MRRFILGLAVWLWAAGAAVAGVPCTLPFNLQNNTTADATQVMANYNALVACLGNAASAGSNSDITALLGLITPIPYTAGGSSVYIGGASTGSANAQVVATPVPNGFSLTAGKSIIFIAGATNTSALQLNVNAQGLTNVFRPTPSGPQALTGGEVVAGDIVVATYDGTQYQLVTRHAEFGGYGPLTNLASATTTDLGTIASHNVNITGTTAITGFGSSCSTTYPKYRLVFAGVLTLTYNATSLITPGAANIITAANDTAEVSCLGSGNAQITGYQRANGTAVVNPTPLCGASGLTITNNGGTPNTNVNVTAASAVLINATGNVPRYTTGYSGTVLLNTTNGTVTSTANGMDGEARPTSAPLYVWLISDGTTDATLGSTSVTAPTMPTNYIYKCYVGAMVTDSSANFYRTKQLGARTQFTVTAGTNTATVLVIANGVAGTFSLTSPALATASVANVVPSTAKTVLLLLASAWKNTASSSILVAPNTAWGGTNNGPQGSAGQIWPAYSTLTTIYPPQLELQLEGTAVAWASSAAGGALGLAGWTDAVNAN